MFQNPLHPQARIPFVGRWHLYDVFYCPDSSGHGCPSASSPCHQLWQSQPLFLQWEAAFFHRDDLLCLYRGWHWGRDPTRRLDSTHRMLWAKSAGCDLNSAARVWTSSPSFTSTRNWWIPSFITADTSRPSTVISCSIVDTAGLDSARKLDHHSFM